jgi:hypothetical protein
MSYTIIKDPVLEPFYLSKDEYCYTVYEIVTPDPKNLEKGSKGKDYQKALGHYTKLSHALNCIAKVKLDHKKEYNSIKSYIQEWEINKQAMETLLESLGI